RKELQFGGRLSTLNLTQSAASLDGRPLPAIGTDDWARLSLAATVKLPLTVFDFFWEGLMSCTWVWSLRAMAAAVLVGGAVASAPAAVITSVAVVNPDSPLPTLANSGGVAAQRENDIAGVISLFGEDKPVYLN